MSLPQLATVVVTYRSADVVGAALQPLAALHQRGELECVVVDNQSDDDTAGVVRREHPWARVIDAGDNLGFGRGCNLGVAHTRAPHVLLLNPDARIDPPAIRRLMAFFATHPQAGIAGPALLDGDGSPTHLHRFPTPARLLREALGCARPDEHPSALPAGAPSRRVDWLCGAVLLVRRAVFERLGGFDPVTHPGHHVVDRDHLDPEVGHVDDFTGDHGFITHHRVFAGWQDGEIRPDDIVEDVGLQGLQGGGQAMDDDGRFDAIEDAVDQQGDADNVVHVGMGQENMANLGHGIQIEIAETGTGIDENLVIETQGGRPQAGADTATTP